MALKLPILPGGSESRLSKFGDGNHNQNDRRRETLLTVLRRGLSPRALAHDEMIVVQHIREGRFQRSLSLVTAFSSLLSGLEVTYEHYIGSYSQQIMYTPVFASVALFIAGVWGTFNRWVARVVLPHKITREGIIVEQDVREGRFQRAMGIATAIAAFCSGFESLYSHYKNEFTFRIDWTPILLTPAVIVAGIGTVWSRTIARTLLPLTSARSAWNWPLTRSMSTILRRGRSIRRLMRMLRPTLRRWQLCSKRSHWLAWGSQKRLQSWRFTWPQMLPLMSPAQRMS